MQPFCGGPASRFAVWEPADLRDGAAGIGSPWGLTGREVPGPRQRSSSRRCQDRRLGRHQGTRAYGGGCLGRSRAGWPMPRTVWPVPPAEAQRRPRLLISRSTGHGGYFRPPNRVTRCTLRGVVLRRCDRPRRHLSVSGAVSGRQLDQTPNQRSESDTLIDAPLEAVWKLVAEPAFWVEDRDLVSGRTTQSGEELIVENPIVGRVVVRIEEVSIHMHLLSMEQCLPPVRKRSAPTTHPGRVHPGGRRQQTRVAVVESGFANLVGPHELRSNAVAFNIEGAGAVGHAAIELARHSWCTGRNHRERPGQGPDRWSGRSRPGSQLPRRRPDRATPRVGARRLGEEGSRHGVGS